VYDIAILGGGPGGYVAAIRAAQLEQKVVLIEKDPKLGGTCLHRGCIPTKTWLHDSDFFYKVQHSLKYAVRLSGAAQMDIELLLKRKNEVISRMALGLDGLMKKNRVEVKTGFGKLVAGRPAIEVGQEMITAKNIVLATGSVPALLPGLELGPRVLTSDQILELDHIPKSIIILGAGAVGMEFASIYRRLGSEVTVVELQDRVLPLEDAEISLEVAKSYGKQGIVLRTGVKLEECQVLSDKVRARIGQDWLEAEILLCAAGRKPVLEGVGADHLEKQGRFLKVNGFMQTSQSNVYAIGDIVPTAQLAHVASAEGMVAVEHASGRAARPLDYGKIPNATYCHPEVASVGLTEQQAQEKGYKVKVGRFPWAALGKATIVGQTEGLVKVVADEQFGELLGVHIVGPHATDLIHEACVAMQCEATVEELFRTVHAHPTLAEGVMEAAHGVFHNPIHFFPPPAKKR